MKHLSQIDMDSGEVLEGSLVFVPKKRISPFSRHFSMNQDGLLFLANELNGEQFRVLMVVLSELDYENYIHVVQSELAKKIHMDKGSFSKNIKKLIAIDLIQEGPKIGRSKTYRLNPQFGWKGTVTNHKKALKHGLTVIDGGKAT
ncbi:MAG TPA: MarR family transcriptional regulator [Arsenophonus nasoniae]|uniref:MarR family transcriptional regulator n=1 Tax=Arsenophonus nasoniae TaxID=638 RepID=UPI00387913C6